VWPVGSASEAFGADGRAATLGGGSAPGVGQGWASVHDR